MSAEHTTQSHVDGHAPAAVTESSQIQKQKLDCALQMARTVALDFNNALTSILGHAFVSNLLPSEYRRPWQLVWIGIEADATMTNKGSYNQNRGRAKGR